MSGVQTGSCNCGGVSYTVSGPMRSIVGCHCGQCRKQSGLYFAATDVSDVDLAVTDKGSLTWYGASDEAKRGFCNQCGSALFWKAHGSDCTSLMVGALDGDPGIRFERHIYTADKGAFYEITDGLPQYPQDDAHDPRPARDEK